MKIDLNQLEPRAAHDLLGSTIIPRPIAWVSTLSARGEPNLAPFSFFTGIQWYPPVIAFSVVNREDGSEKDTLSNIRQVPEFVVHMVSADLMPPMEASAKRIPPGEDENAIGGITLIPSDRVAPLRIAEARAAFECTLERIVTVDEGANAGNLILGRVRLFHAHDEIIKAGREVDWQALGALGRLSGSRYCVIDHVIESENN